MVSALDQQVFACAVLALAGVAIGFWFDLLRAWRTVFAPELWWAALGDLIFWLVVAVTVGGALYLGNWGEIRLYVLISLVLGAGCYGLCASRVVRATLVMLLRVLVAVVRLLVRAVYRVIWVPALMLAGLVWRGIAWLLRLVSRVLWWLIRPLVLSLWHRLEPVIMPRVERLRSIYGRIRAWLSREPMD